MAIRVGVDIVNITRIERIITRYPQRFLDRVLSIREKELFTASGSKIETLAAAFAAKEAVLKAIGCGIGPAALNEIEVLAPGGRQPQVKLKGITAQMAREKHINGISISMSHEPPYACAIAAAY